MSSGEPLIWIFFVIVACAAGLALIAVRGGGSMPVRLGAMALMVALVGGGYAGLAELMSRPKPVTLEWVRGAAQSARVAASHMRENEAIYLWLVLEGETEPRAYRLPWSTEMAKQLRDAQSDAERRKGEVRMTRPFRSQRGEDERVFHSPPRAALPPKRAESS